MFFHVKNPFSSALSRAHLSSRSRDVNNNVVSNNNVYEEHEDEDDDELERVPRRFAKDLMARQNMQEFSGCIPKRRKKKLYEQQQDKTEYPQQHDADTRDDSTQPKVSCDSAANNKNKNETREKLKYCNYPLSRSRKPSRVDGQLSHLSPQKRKKKNPSVDFLLLSSSVLKHTMS
jgi:hypothetical protein